MTLRQRAEIALSSGEEYPYDAPDSYMDPVDEYPPPAQDWAHAAARGVIADLEDRAEIKYGFGNVREHTRVDIVQSLAEIIRVAYTQEKINAQ